MKQFPPSPRVSHKDRFEFFRKFAEIFASQGAPPVSTTPVANLQICHRCYWHRWQIAAGINDTGGKFATGINDTGGKFRHQFPLCCWHRWQIIRTVSGCRNFKVNLKAKIYLYMVTLLPKGAQTKVLKFFCLKIFSICHRCRWHRWCTLSREYLREFSKKFEKAVLVYSEAWRKLIHEKNQKSKISWHCPFKWRYVLWSFVVSCYVYSSILISP